MLIIAETIGFALSLWLMLFSRFAPCKFEVPEMNSKYCTKILIPILFDDYYCDLITIGLLL